MILSIESKQKIKLALSLFVMPGHHDHDLSFDLFGCKMGLQFGYGCRFDFFVFFAELPGHAGNAFGPTMGSQLFETSQEAVRRFIQDKRVFERRQVFQPCLTPFFVRQKTFVMKSVAWYAAGH